MIKIRLNKNKIINELEKNTPQYKETQRVLSDDKTALETVFQGKRRIVLEIDIVPPSLADSITKTEEISNYIVDNSYNYLINYTKVNEPTNDPERAAKRKKLAQDPFVITTLKLIELAKDLDDKEEKIKYWMSEIMNRDIKRYNNNDLTVDFATRKIYGTRHVKDPRKITYSINSFLELHIKACKEMEAYFNTLDEQQKSDAQWDITKFRKEQNLPEATPSGEKLIALIEKLLGDKVEQYIKSGLLFNVGLQVARGKSEQESINVSQSEHLSLLKSLLDKFGYERLTNRVPNKMTMVLTRVPIEIVRMSDFPQLDSCHAVGGMYASCATQEAVSEGGAVAYLFQELYNAGKKKRMEKIEREFLKDPDRGIRGSNPITRMRLRTFKITARGDTKEKYLVIPSSKQYGRAYNSMFDTLKEFLLSTQSQVISELKDAMTSQMVYIQLLGGGYYQGSIQSEVEEFLGINKTNNLLFTREYPGDYEPNLPNEDNVAEEYERVIDEIVSNDYPDLPLDKSISVNVNVTGDSQGYESGESEPNLYPDYEVGVNITYSLQIGDIYNNLADSILNKLSLDETRKNEVVELIKKNKEEMFSGFQVDIRGFQLSEYPSLEGNYVFDYPRDAESDLTDDIQKMNYARESLIDIENYSGEFQEIFVNHFNESSVTEAKKIFKRFMRF